MVNIPNNFTSGKSKVFIITIMIIGIAIIVNITNNTDSQVTATEGGFDQQAQRFILDVVIDGAQRNVNGFGSNLRTMMGS